MSDSGIATCGVAGGSQAASHFSCFAKKSNQKKATPASSALRAPLCYSGRPAAAKTRTRGYFYQTVLICARPQTIAADCPGRPSFGKREACFAKPLPHLGDSDGEFKVKNRFKGKFKSKSKGHSLANSQCGRSEKCVGVSPFSIPIRLSASPYVFWLYLCHIITPSIDRAMNMPKMITIVSVLRRNDSIMA